MVVYRELSSLCHDLGFSARALYTASNTIDKHYHNVAIPNGYKRRLRQELYYCKKYGIESHLSHAKQLNPSENYRSKLLGKVNYILSVEPENEEIKGYKRWLINQKNEIEFQKIR